MLEVKSHLLKKTKELSAQNTKERVLNLTATKQNT
jgi:hypothetical protein